ncbi:hypothetical protein EDB84DRAFT_1563609 [Lactarius hengduanensis]|nr:hypothetical protein EDB84DRAFT_1563609 [Lactarius hengduanensis]
MVATSANFRVARKRARPFAIACDHPDQQGSMQPTVPIPDLAAPLRGLSISSTTHHRLRWPPLRSFASRGSVRDRLRLPATTRPSRAQDTTATATDLPTTPRTPRRPARLLAPLHTPQPVFGMHSTPFLAPCSMQNCYAFEAIDRSLRDICEQDDIFREILGGSPFRAVVLYDVADSAHLFVSHEGAVVPMKQQQQGARRKEFQSSIKHV